MSVLTVFGHAAEQVDLKTKKTASGADYKAISSSGAVPALQLDDGTVITELIAVVSYIADKVSTCMHALLCVLECHGSQPRHQSLTHSS